MNLIKRRKNLYKFVRVDSAGRKRGANQNDHAILTAHYVVNF
jgi:hypothetical protein